MKSVFRYFWVLRMMTTKFIAPSRKKQRQLSLMLGALTLILWGIARWLYIELSRITISLWILSGASLFLLVYNIADFAFNPPNKRGLYLDQEGVLFQQTLLGRQIGKILWKDITDIQIQKNYLWLKAIYLRLKSPDKYLAKVSSQETKKLILEQGFPISDSELEIELNELFNRIQSYFH